jgi:hypothetical protein
LDHGAAPAPTGREFFISEGIAHQTEAESKKIWSHHLIWPEDYDQTISKRYWWDLFETKDSPCAKAHRLLSKIDIGRDRESSGAPLLEFHEGDRYPGDSSLRVNAIGPAVAVPATGPAHRPRHAD